MFVTFVLCKNNFVSGGTMKNFTLILAMLFIALTSAYSHSIITVQHGNNAWFYDYDRLDSAISQAPNGASIYLPSGTFISPATSSTPLNKQLHFYGVGYAITEFSTGRTHIKGSFYLLDGADSSSFSGIYFENEILINTNPPKTVVSKVTFRRCIFSSFGSVLSSKRADKFVFEEIVAGSISYVKSSTFKNCIFSYLSFCDDNSIENCIFYFNGTSNFLRGDNNSLKNNIITQTNINYLIYGDHNNFLNNLFVSNISFPAGTNQGVNNLVNVGIETIFINRLNYTQPQADLRLKDDCVGKEAGSDGTDVGIYGGPYPFKHNRLPFIPFIKSTAIGPADEQNKIRVRMNVEAQTK